MYKGLKIEPTVSAMFILTIVPPAQAGYVSHQLMTEKGLQKSEEHRDMYHISVEAQVWEVISTVDC